MTHDGKSCWCVYPPSSEVVEGRSARTAAGPWHAAYCPLHVHPEPTRERYDGPWLVGERAEYTDESLSGYVQQTFKECGVNKVVFLPDRQLPPVVTAITCSDDHLIPVSASHCDKLREILGALVEGESEPCSFDRHGHCQTHGWFGDSGECGVREARRLLGIDT